MFVKTIIRIEAHVIVGKIWHQISAYVPAFCISRIERLKL